MRKFFSFLGNTLIVLYYAIMMLVVVLYLPIVLIDLLQNIFGVVRYGFCINDPNVVPAHMVLFGLLISISLLVPPLRRAYRRVPWLFPYVRLLYTDFMIVGWCLLLLERLLQVHNDTRHLVLAVINIFLLVLSRMIMCYYFDRRPVRHVRLG